MKVAAIQNSATTVLPVVPEVAVNVFSGPCYALQPLGCSDKNRAPQGEQLSVPGLDAGTYLINISRENSLRGVTSRVTFHLKE